MTDLLPDLIATIDSARGRMCAMANRPKTPTHTVRVEDDLWDSAVAATAAYGDTVSGIVRERLREYLAEHPMPRPDEE